MDILNLNDIHALVGQPTKAQNDELVAKLLLTISKLQPLKEHQRIVVPELKFDLKGRTAGEAYQPTNRDENGNITYPFPIGTIRLNLDLLNDERYYQDMLCVTLPHEVCHIVCDQFYPNERSHHGGNWQYMMYYIGLNAERCHQYETTAARKVARPFIYACACREHKMTNNLHGKMLNGQKRYCKRCRGILTYVRTED